MRDPKIQAAAVLDNYMPMQYQIVARQLTLLRDEAGRDRRGANRQLCRPQTGE